MILSRSQPLIAVRVFIEPVPYPLLPTMLTWPLTLALFLGALLLHLEIVRRDFEAPKPPAPYWRDQLKGLESLDSDSEISPNPCFPNRR